MMLHKMSSKLCRLCGKEKQQGTDVFKDKVKGAVLVSIINKYFSKEVIIIRIIRLLKNLGYIYILLFIYYIYLGYKYIHVRCILKVRLH